MKAKLFTIILVITTLLMISSSLKAQQTVLVSKKGSGWDPAKITADGNNVFNGVAFFRKEGECNTNKVVLLKIVNTNKFPVKVQWQESADLTKSIVIPSSTSIEGKCNSGFSDSAESKLAILKSKIDQEEKTKEYFLFTLVITEVKN